MDINNINVDELLDKKEENKEESLEERFSRERLEWSNKIKNMSKKMKDICNVSELMTDIYTERQLGVEYYHYLLTILSKINQNYRKQWAEKFDYYTYKYQKRFPNEKTKELQILSDLSELVQKREHLDIMIKFMNQTISTIDNLIYGIKYKVEIEQIMRGK